MVRHVVRTTSTAAAWILLSSILLSLQLLHGTHCFVVVPAGHHRSSHSSVAATSEISSLHRSVSALGVSTDVNQDTIISPFDNENNNHSGDDVDSKNDSGTAGGGSTGKIEGPLELTWENVELVLDEMRPFLIQDGGNVAVKEIDGPVVRLELQVS